MNTVNDITEELNNLDSPLARLSKVMPYSVPAGYFENLPGKTLKVAAGLIEADSVPEWPKTMTQSVPQGYFENLADNILSAVKAESIMGISSKKMPFNVPAGYFEALPAQMLHIAKRAGGMKKETTRIPLVRHNSFRQIRWAAAAVLLICIGFGGYETFYIQPDNTEKMLASVPNNEIQDYLQHTYVFDVNRVVSNEDINNIEVDNKDIIQYLNETGWDMTE
jgi:hypothetical protein